LTVELTVNGDVIRSSVSNDETIGWNLSSRSGFNESMIVNTAPITAAHPEGSNIARPVVTRSGRMVKPVTRLDL
jgi:hypothetical protein